MQGIVKFINDDRGFGFITQEDGTEIFFGIDSIEESSVWPERFSKVSYEIGSNKKGPAAIHVRVL